jgi:hypothetical protein
MLIANMLLTILYKVLYINSAVEKKNMQHNGEFNTTGSLLGKKRM